MLGFLVFAVFEISYRFPTECHKMMREHTLAKRTENPIIHRYSLGDNSSTMLFSSFHARATYLSQPCTSAQFPFWAISIVGEEGGRVQAYFVWLPRATNSSLTFVNWMEV